MYHNRMIRQAHVFLLLILRQRNMVTDDENMRAMYYSYYTCFESKSEVHSKDCVGR